MQFVGWQLGAFLLELRFFACSYGLELSYLQLGLSCLQLEPFAYSWSFFAYNGRVCLSPLKGLSARKLNCKQDSSNCKQKNFPHQQKYNLKRFSGKPILGGAEMTTILSNNNSRILTDP